MKQIFSLLILLTANLLLAQKPRLVVPMGHIDIVNSVVFSPNGQYVLTGSEDGTAKLWDLSGREQVTFAGHQKSVNSVAFSPDGKQVLTGSADGTAKLWDLSGNVLQIFTGTSNISSVAFSPDGKQVLTGSLDGTAKLWNLSGKELVTFPGQEKGVSSVAFSPDGKKVLTGSADNTAKLWDLSGKMLQTFSGHAKGKFEENGINSVAFSPDGKQVLTGSGDGTAKLWDLSGKVLQTFARDVRGVSAVAFSPDGKKILTAGNWQDDTAALWDLSGKVLQTFTVHAFSITSVAFSPNGKLVLTGSLDYKARLWDLSGSELQTFTGHSSYPRSVAFSPDGKLVLTVYGDTTLKVWNLSERALQPLVRPSISINSAAFSPDGKHVLTGHWDFAVKLWDLSGKELHTYPGHRGDVGSVAFSPNGQYVLTGSGDGTAKLWDLSGKELHTFFGAVDPVSAVAFSPDGNMILNAGSWDSTAMLYDLTGKELQIFSGHSDGINSVAFSPNGKQVLTGSTDYTAKLWDLSGKVLSTFSGHHKSISSVAFSPDGKQVLTTGWDNTAKLWDLSGKELRSFAGHTQPVNSGTFSPNGKQVLTGSLDNTSKLWDTQTGKLLATFIAIDSNDWVVTTPSGLFDASPGAMKIMHYMIGLEVISLKQLKTRYYEPYLLQKIMGFTPGGLRPVNELNDVPLYPEVLEASIKNDRLKVRLNARSGGIGSVALELDGSVLVDDINPARKTDFKFNLKPYLDFFLPLKPNHLSLKLYNEKGWLESQEYVLEHAYDGVEAKGPSDPATGQPKRSLNEPADLDLEKIHFYALVVGTSKYRDEGLNLKYPEKDAAMFADALRKAGSKLFKDRVEVKLLSTEMEPWPRKEVIRKALFDMKAKATPDDILLVYFSGHGITYPPVSEAGQFYYLTTDIASDKLQDEAILKTQAIAQDSLMDWVRQIKARKRILIYDACNSGSVVAHFETGAKDLNTDQRRALERMKDRTGMYVLAGSATDKSSYEASNYGHGLLTYSLINGMLNVAARNKGDVELGDLFAFVEDDVERLAKNINREQRPEVIAAESYPIGQIDANTDIKMPVELPIFVQTVFLYSKKGKDLLGLSAAFNTELNRLASEKAPGIVFWDVGAFSGKYYYLGGEYEAAGDNITGTVYLYASDQELHAFPFSGSKTNLKRLAQDVVFEVQEYLAKNPGK